MSRGGGIREGLVVLGIDAKLSPNVASRLKGRYGTLRSAGDGCGTPLKSPATTLPVMPGSWGAQHRVMVG